MPAEAPLLILQRGAFLLVQLEANMSEHNEENGQENPSKAKPTKKQSKEESGTLTDYYLKRAKEEGILVKKKKLPKDWVRVIFKR